MIDNDDPTNAAPIFRKLQRPLRTGLALIALSALVGLVAFSHRRYFPTKSVRVSVVKYRGQTAPDFSLKTSYGGPFKLSSLRNKAVLLTFYGNTCAPCRAETPWLVDFQNRYKDKGLEIVGVEMYGSSPESIRTFATEFRVGYRLLVGSDIVGDLYSVGGLPTNYYINRKGMLLHATEGAMPQADMEAFIQQALE